MEKKILSFLWKKIKEKKSGHLLPFFLLSSPFECFTLSLSLSLRGVPFLPTFFKGKKEWKKKTAFFLSVSFSSLCLRSWTTPCWPGGRAVCGVFSSFFFLPTRTLSLSFFFHGRRAERRVCWKRAWERGHPFSPFLFLFKKKEKEKRKEKRREMSGRDGAFSGQLPPFLFLLARGRSLLFSFFLSFLVQRRERKGR